MRFSKTKSDRGSAVLELISFVLVGQLLISGWFVQIAGELDRKVRMQLFAISMARAASLGNSSLEANLRQDLGLANAQLRNLPCIEPLVCLEVLDESVRVVGVSHK